MRAPNNATLSILSALAICIMACLIFMGLTFASAYFDPLIYLTSSLLVSSPIWLPLVSAWATKNKKIGVGVSGIAIDTLVLALCAKIPFQDFHNPPAQWIIPGGMALVQR